MFTLETERLTITEFTPDMAQAVHENSLDEDNRRFVPDEVFETVDDAAETIEFLMSCYGRRNRRSVYISRAVKGRNKRRLCSSCSARRRNMGDRLSYRC